MALLLLQVSVGSEAGSAAPLTDLVRRIFGGAAQLTVAFGIGRALNIVTLPLITALLGPAAYGHAALATTLISLTSVLALMGLDMSYSRAYLSVRPETVVQLDSFIWRVGLGLAVIGACAGSIAWFFLTTLASQADRAGLTTLVFLGIVGTVASSLAQTRARLVEEYTRLAIGVGVAGAATAITALAAAYELRQGPIPLVLGTVVGVWLLAGWVGLPPIKVIFSTSGIARARAWQIVAIGLPGIITAPMYWIVGSMDRWFMVRARSTAEVGIYSVAATISVIGLMISSALASVWLPEVTRAIETPNSTTRQRLGDLMLLMVAAMGSVWLVLAGLRTEIVQLLLDRRYWPAARYLPLLSLGVFFYGAYHLVNVGLYIERKLTQTALVWIVVGVGSITANALLAARYGAMACAIVQAASFFGLAGGTFLLAQRSFPIAADWSRLAKMLLLLGVSFFLLSVPWADTPLRSLALKVPALIVALLLMYRNAASPEFALSR